MIVKEPTGCEKQTCCDILELEKPNNPIARLLDDAVPVGKTIWIYRLMQAICPHIWQKRH